MVNVEKTISLRTKIGYGLAETGIISAEFLTQIYLVKFYIEQVGIKPSILGIALFIAVFWDAISDPIMGVISDKTRSRYGKRRPYILIGGIALAISIITLFSIPHLPSQFAKFIYLLSTYIFVNTAMTIISVPHISLGGELSFDRDQRTVLYGFRLLFGNLGMIIGMIAPVIILESLGSITVPHHIALSRSYASIWIGGIIAVTSISTFLLTKEKITTVIHTTDQEPISFISFIQSVLSVLKNKVFIPLLLAFMIATFGRTFNSAIALYYYEYRLQLNEKDVVVNILLPFIIVIIASIPFWIFLSKKFGKKMPAFWGIFLLGLMTFIAYPLFPVGEIKPPLLAAFFGGIFAGSILLFDSILADVVDYDELKTGEHREGLYFGFWKMATKLARAIGLGLTGVLLELIAADTNNPSDYGFKLAILFGPVVGSFFILGALVFLWMPLTDQKHKQVQKLLAIKNKRILS